MEQRHAFFFAFFRCVAVSMAEVGRTVARGQDSDVMALLQMTEAVPDPVKPYGVPDRPCRTKAEIETVPAACVTEVEDVDADPENDDPQESEYVEVVVDDEEVGPAEYEEMPD